MVSGSKEKVSQRQGGNMEQHKLDFFRKTFLLRIGFQTVRQAFGSAAARDRRSFGQGKC